MLGLAQTLWEAREIELELYQVGHEFFFLELPPNFLCGLEGPAFWVAPTINETASAIIDLEL